MIKKVFILMFFMLSILNGFSQTGDKWYNNFPKNAKWIDSTLMKIGSKNYHVYNVFAPISPKGGERIIDFSGVLNYYMWIFNTQNGFKIAKIDMKLNIFYYNEETGEFANPSGEILQE